MRKEISKQVIRRMPRYYRYLGDLVDRGVERISSRELSEMMHVTSSQVRQDLNTFGDFGQQGYGYSVPYLHNEIAKILGIDNRYQMIVLGAGNLGQAIVKYDKFEKLGFKTVALFDTNPAIANTRVNGIPVYSLDKLEEFCDTHRVDIAALTLPKENAEAVAKRVIDMGVHAIWNFAHIDLDIPDANIVCENVHLTDSLMRLSFNMTMARG